METLTLSELVCLANSEGFHLQDVGGQLHITGPNGHQLRSQLEERSAEIVSFLQGVPAPGDEPDDLKDFAEEPPRRSKKGEKSQADLLFELAQARYEFGQSFDGEPFAVQRSGPRIARMLRGSRDCLRASLAKEFRVRFGKVPSASALADALVALSGVAADATPTELHLRCAAHGENVYIDLGDTSGRVVEVAPDGWQVVKSSPVLFRRTALTNPLPTPAPEGDLDLLRDFLNCTDETWPLLRGWLVAGLCPSIPHAILLLGGQQGTGKSTAAKMLSLLIDPSPAPLRTEPRDVDSWATAASGSWLVTLDNVSSVPAWLSDALCKSCTGDGVVRRRLYTDQDLAVLAFRRVVCMTSIDPGALRGDLADRLCLVDLEVIPDRLRRTDAELAQAFEEARGRMFGGLLTALSNALEALPEVDLQELPRLADFGKLLAALDKADNMDVSDEHSGFQLFMNQRGRLAAEVVEADPIAMSIVGLLENQSSWSGTASDLLAEITPERAPRGWPQSAKSLGGRLKRISPALERLGIETSHGKTADSSRKRLITMTRKGT